MQVTQTLNNTVNIVFDPHADGFCLLDFVLIEDSGKRFLGQIIEIENDKFDASLNYASVKILYMLNSVDEIIEYNGFTPTKLCKMYLCNQKEVEEFINLDKNKFQVGLNPKTMLPLDFNLEFFTNNPVIYADKMEDLHVLSGNFAQKLSQFKNVVIIDYTGSLNVKNSLRLRATVDFKLPLDFYSLDFVWNIALANASLETQAVCEDIFNEVKEYAKSIEGGFIPFNQFVKAVAGQYKQTPISELLVLRNRLVKYQQSSIFAKTAKEIDIVRKTAAQEKITIIDLSPLNVLWHKEFVNFILRSIKTPSFIFIRLNETNSDQNLITKIFQTRGAVSIIPSISYGYKKMPAVAEHSKNYILLPTLKPSRDFGYADCAIWTLDQNHALLFGTDTKELIFKIQNTVTIDEETAKDKKSRRIKLSNLQRYSAKFENKFDKVKLNQKQDEIVLEEIKPTVLPSVLFEREEEQRPSSSVQEDAPTIKEEVQNNYEEIDFDEPKTAPAQDLGHDAFESNDEEENPIQYIEKPRVKEILQGDEDEDFIQLVNDIEDVELEETISKIEPKEVYSKVYDSGISKLISEDELDYFDNAKNTTYQEVDYSQKMPEKEKEEVEENWHEGEVYTQAEEDDNLSLEDLAKQSVEDTFDELVEDSAADINEKFEDIVVEGEGTINLGKIQEQIKNKENELPVFNKEEAEQTKQDFDEGDSVMHEKYGQGKILKVVTYSNRCLLQIEFDKIGKRLLDPTIAKLQKI